MKIAVLISICFLLNLNVAKYKSDLNKDLVSLYKPEMQIQIQKEEIAFWKQKVADSPRQISFQKKLAQANTQMFKLNADIQFLKSAENILNNLRLNTATGDADVLRSLAHNYITQHRFCEALESVKKALSIGSNKRASKLMLFDLYEELGDEENQKILLEELSMHRDFDYLIRQAKWEDGQGRLENTIALMKKAETIAENSQQKQLMNWLYSNLGDYYGHFGDIENSKHYFTKSLELNPADWYSLKGLAWIKYSFEKDSESALELIKEIKPYCKDPAVLILESEILDYLGKPKLAKSVKAQIFNQVNSTSYGVMYNNFLFESYLSDPYKIELAFEIARNEIDERQIPASYDLLAQAYYQKGEIAKAQEISLSHILNKTYEPNILLNQVYYFKGQQNEQVQKIKNEVMEASFELGPLKIEQLVNFLDS